MGKKAEKSKKKNTVPETNAQDNPGSSNNKNNNGRKIITDPRFSSIHSDPRFQKAPKHQSKVSIDARFNRMFTDKNFGSSNAPVDKRGKSKNSQDSSLNPLAHYYKIDEEEGKLKKKKVESESEDEDENEDEDEGSEEEEDLKKVVGSGSSDDALSGENEDSESSDESGDDDVDGSDSENSTDEEFEFAYEEESEKEEVPEIEQETHRLAVVNMDWSQVRAVDLYVVLSSFLPKGGQIISVSVYPSEFGRKRMEEEAVKGPVGLFDSEDEKSDGKDGDDNDEIDSEKLRAYEKSRLRYYFAVVECDTIATADYIYKSCDGIEFERTSNVLDLRFIPDTMQFEHPPRDVATEAPTLYEGLDFQTQALQQSKVRLTWDEDEPQRAKTLKRKLTEDELMELEYRDYLASDDGDSEEEEEEDNDEENNGAADGLSDKKLEKLEKYRALLQSKEGSDEDNSDDDKDMEVTFNTGLEDLSKQILERKRDKKSETVWEATLRRQKEKKKAKKNKSKDSSDDETSESDDEVRVEADDFFVEEPKKKKKKKKKVGKSSKEKEEEEEKEDIEKEKEASKAELELLLADDDENDLKGYNLKKKKSKGKKGKEKEILAEEKLPSVDLNDPRFSSLFTSPLFALDPTDAQYKRSASYARQVAQKQHKSDGEATEKPPPKETPQPAVDPELSSLIRSVKRKAEHHATSNKASKKAAPMQSNGLLTKMSSKVLSGKKKSRSSKG